MATVTSPPPAPAQRPLPQPAAAPPAPAPPAPATAPASDDFTPTWEHTGHRGDTVALVIWLLSVGALALMTLLAPLAKLFR